MKNNQLAQMLLIVLLLSALYSAWLTLRYTSSVRALQGMQQQVVNGNNSRSFFQTLLNETTEYGNKNPQFKASLPAIQMGVRPGVTAERPAK